MGAGGADLAEVVADRLVGPADVEAGLLARAQELDEVQED